MRSHLIGLIALTAGTACGLGDVRLPDALSFTERPPGARVEIVESISRALLVTPDLPAAVTDDLDGARYALVCHVYVEENGRAVRRFVVHAPETASAPHVGRTGRFLALLWAAADQRFGRLCGGLRRAPLHVYLTRDGDAVAEMTRGRLYIRKYQETRSGLEWARTLAHEYGHYLLPSPSGYTDPESWANGVLGERLFLGWLRDALAAGDLAETALGWGSAEELEEYARRQVLPLRARMRQDGPDVEALKRRDKEAMDAFTALMLGVDALHGGSTLMDMLDFLPTGGARPLTGEDYLRAYTLWVGRSPRIAWRLQPGIPTRVYLPAGVYEVSAAASPSTAIRFAASPDIRWDGNARKVSARSTGWYLLTHEGSQSATLIARRMAPVTAP